MSTTIREMRRKYRSITETDSPDRQIDKPAQQSLPDTRSNDSPTGIAPPSCRAPPIHRYYLTFQADQLLRILHPLIQANHLYLPRNKAYYCYHHVLRTHHPLHPRYHLPMDLHRQKAPRRRAPSPLNHAPQCPPPPLYPPRARRLTSTDTLSPRLPPLSAPRRRP